MNETLVGAEESEGAVVRRSSSKNRAKFSGKHLCWSLFLVKFQALRPANLSKSDTSKGVFL